MIKGIGLLGLLEINYQVSVVVDVTCLSHTIHHQ